MCSFILSNKSYFSARKEVHGFWFLRRLARDANLIAAADVRLNFFKIQNMKNQKEFCKSFDQSLADGKLQHINYMKSREPQSS